MITRAAKLGLLVTTTGVSISALTIFDSSSRPFDEVKATFNGLTRSSYTVITIAATVFDYKYSLYGLAKGSNEYMSTISMIHLRSARRILKLCEYNKGFYVKAAQFAASLRQIPKEYTSTLSVLQDQAVPCDFRLIKQVICKSLSSELTDMFISFNEQPIAAASIAQVHHAMLKTGEEVAVKVQYPCLQQLMDLDIKTMSFVSDLVTWLFPEYRFKWVLSAFSVSISAELDFVHEARNSERTAKNFRTNKNVKVPRVFWDLTKDQVLTMEFCYGHKIDDLESLEKSGLNPRKVAKALVEVFAEMIFIHGFIHGDPHPGNIFVSSDEQTEFKLVLLDHGMYKELDEGFRRDHCRLWKALILRDADELQSVGESFGVGNYAKYFPLIFTGKTINSKSGLGKDMSIEEKKIVKQELKGLDIEDISLFMESLPLDFMTILRTDGIIKSILSKLGASRSVRILTYANYAVHGLSLSNASKSSGFSLELFISNAKTKFNLLQFKCLIGVLELHSWMDDIKNLVTQCFKIFLATARRLNLLNPGH